MYSLGYRDCRLERQWFVNLYEFCQVTVFLTYQVLIIFASNLI
jgi:hypothetical protein